MIGKDVTHVGKLLNEFKTSPPFDLMNPPTRGQICINQYTYMYVRNAHKRTLYSTYH
jgi:hypothetical protein